MTLYPPTAERSISNQEVQLPNDLKLKTQNIETRYEKYTKYTLLNENENEIAKATVSTEGICIKMGWNEDTIVEENYRHRGIATYLFYKRAIDARNTFEKDTYNSFLKTRNPEDNSDERLVDFLKKIGVVNVQEQYENDYTTPRTERLIYYTGTLDQDFFTRAEKYIIDFESPELDRG